ncbi:MAG: helix-hairpin-helix domain-containing protein [Phycisphaerales bacterium]|nr:MAG: helix-hairpin-helix domain-containing protein [Phycisphaerales bacterium]
MTTDSCIDLSVGRDEGIQSAAFAISVCVAACLSIGFVVAGSLRSGPSYQRELDGRINPNDAPVASLVRLPSIGVARAEAIVAHREAFRSMRADGQAFRTPSDLQKVKGIGPETTKKLRQWLKFE